MLTVAVATPSVHLLTITVAVAALSVHLLTVTLAVATVAIAMLCVHVLTIAIAVATFSVNVLTATVAVAKLSDNVLTVMLLKRTQFRMIHVLLFTKFKVNISVMFHEAILNDFNVIDWTRFCDRTASCKVQRDIIFYTPQYAILTRFI